MKRHLQGSAQVRGLRACRLPSARFWESCNHSSPLESGQEQTPGFGQRFSRSCFRHIPRTFRTLAQTDSWVSVGDLEAVGPLGSAGVSKAESLLALFTPPCHRAGRGMACCLVSSTIPRVAVNKKQKSSGRPREDVAIILGNFLPEARGMEPRKPQYLDRRLEEAGGSQSRGQSWGGAWVPSLFT